jgi:hypothetical protein
LASTEALKCSIPSSRPGRQVVQQCACDASALPLVDHGNGDLGDRWIVGRAHEASDADAFIRFRVDGLERFVPVVSISVRYRSCAAESLGVGEKKRR